MSLHRVLEHPLVGFIQISGHQDTGITGVSFHKQPPEVPQSSDPFLAEVETHLEAYFLGELIDFSWIPVTLDGTAFQQSVWKSYG